jgi:anti-anti-sigma regulatory factor
MTATQGVVRVRQDGQTATFQVHDRATLAQSHAFRRKAEQLLDGGAGCFRIDLRHCTHIDSTFLGTLLYLKRRLDEKAPGGFVLVSPSRQAGCILEQMGVDEILAVIEADEPSDDRWEELGAGNEDMNNVKANVSQAHEELAQLPGPAGQIFRNVMRCLSRAEEQDERP